MVSSSNVYAKVGKNIRALRKAYGENIVELAFALGLNSPSSITNYEKGNRIPKRDVLHKIALHYKTTEDELINGDFSNVNLQSLAFDDRTKMRKVSDKMLPIICSEEALADTNFKKGYELHMQIYRKLSDGISYHGEERDACLEAYGKSLDEKSTPEAVANILWWLMLSGFNVIYESMLEGISDVTEKRISSITFLKEYWLNDCDEELYDETLITKENNVRAFLEENEETFMGLIRILSFSPKWRTLAEYYSALRYLFGIVNNQRSIESNRAIGEEMLISIANIGNQYAIEFLNTGK